MAACRGRSKFTEAQSTSEHAWPGGEAGLSPEPVKSPSRHRGSLTSSSGRAASMSQLVPWTRWLRPAKSCAIGRGLGGSSKISNTPGYLLATEVMRPCNRRKPCFSRCPVMSSVASFEPVEGELRGQTGSTSSWVGVRVRAYFGLSKHVSKNRHVSKNIMCACVLCLVIE